MADKYRNMKCEGSLLKDRFSEIAEQMTAKSNLDDVPYILCCVTELTTSNTGTQAVVADGNLIVFELIRKVILTLCHCTDEHTYALVRTEGLDVVFHSYNWALEGQCDLSAIGWQMLGDRVLDHTK